MMEKDMERKGTPEVVLKDNLNNGNIQIRNHLVGLSSPLSKHQQHSGLQQVSTPSTQTQRKESVEICQAEEELFSMLDKDEGQHRGEQTTLEEDKRVLVIYAGGFFGAEYEKSGNNQLFVEPNSLFERMRKIQYFCDLDFTHEHAMEGFLVTPLSEYHRRVYYKVIEVDDLKIESIFFDQKCVEELLELIEANYNAFDSFIVIHGTDSLAYTASFVSFMIENLSKPIIFTGSMVPLSIMRNDSFSNILGALTIAGHFNIPEVCIFFHNQLLRANRSTKIDAQGLDCFTSPNFQPLVDFKVNIEVNWPLVLRNEETDNLFINKKLSHHRIEIVRFTPYFSDISLSSLVNTPEIKGIIIEAYGPGNLPHLDENFAKVCLDAQQKDVFIIAISQSLKSYNSHSNYQANNNLGIVYGGDMTTEATLAKFSYLLSKGYCREEIICLMNTNLRGELTPQSKDQKFEMKQENLFEAISEKFSSGVNHRQSQVDLIKSYIVPNVACYMAKLGLMNELQDMKVQQTNFKFCDYDKRTALHLAASEQKEEVCKFLIDEDVDVNKEDYFGRSPLYEAILRKNKKIVYMLVQKNAQIIANPDELTDLLLESARMGDLDTIKLLFHAGLKNFNDYVNVDSRNIGHIAASEGQLEIIKFLKYTARFDFSQRDIWDRIPLDDAIEFQHTNIVGQLQHIIL